MSVPAKFRMRKHNAFIEKTERFRDERSMRSQNLGQHLKTANAFNAAFSYTVILLPPSVAVRNLMVLRFVTV